jgi:hypothetical protein
VSPDCPKATVALNLRKQIADVLNNTDCCQIRNLLTTLEMGLFDTTFLLIGGVRRSRSATLPTQSAAAPTTTPNPDTATRQQQQNRATGAPSRGPDRRICSELRPETQVSPSTRLRGRA